MYNFIKNIEMSLDDYTTCALKKVQIETLGCIVYVFLSHSYITKSY